MLRRKKSRPYLIKKGRRQDMEGSSSERKRERGWVLIKVRDPEGIEEVVEKLDEGLFFEAGGKEEFVIVRTDVVIGEFDLVVPIDARDAGAFREARALIEKNFDPTELVILKVKKHKPAPPHKADGYIDPEEAEVYPTHRLQVGRQRSSPGANPWG
jgi:hypothetical protein